MNCTIASHLRSAIFVALCLLRLNVYTLRAVSPQAPPAVDPEQQRMVDALKSLKPQQGKISLPGGMADLNLPDDFRYLDANDCRKVLVDLWGNPPDTAQGLIGMIIPKAFYSDDDHVWGATVGFSDVGYIKDEEPDYGKLLQQIKDGQEKNNEDRVKAGYKPMHIVGWAQPPHYDNATKKLYWAKELFSEGRSHSLNYDIRILGRRGSLDLSIISGIEELPQINNVVPTLLATVNFNDGHRYADFDPKTDKVAPYALAGLIGGGLLLAKVGGLKWLIAGLLAAKKFVIVGVLAVVGFVKRLFGGGTKVNMERPAIAQGSPTPPTPPPAV